MDIKKWLGVSLVLLSLIGCGGGSDSGGGTAPKSSNKAPTADASTDQAVDELSTVTLTGNGSDSDGTIAGYLWEQTDGTLVTLVNSATATASFTAPNISVDETLTFKLKVTDDDGATDVDLINIIVSNVEESIPGQLSLETTELNINVDFIDDLPTSTYELVGFADVKSLTTSSITLEVSNALGGQIIYLSSEDESIQLPIWISSEDKNKGENTVSFENIADSLIMLTPLVWGIERELKLSILANVKLQSEYSSFVDIVESTVRATPESLLEPENSPELWTAAYNLIRRALEDEQLTSTLHKTKARFSKSIAQSRSSDSNDKIPYLTDELGTENITLHNPTYIFWDYAKDGEFEGVLAGKNKVFEIKWPLSKMGTDPNELSFNLGYGQHVFSMSHNTYWQVYAANFVKGSCLALDIVFYCPLPNSSIESVLAKGKNLELESYTESVKNFIYSTGVTDPFEAMSGFIALLAPDLTTNKSSKAYVLFEKAAIKGSKSLSDPKWITKTGKFLKTSKGILNKLSKFVLLPLDLTRSVAPFLWDLNISSFGYPKLESCLDKSSTWLEYTCQTIPPVAKIAELLKLEYEIGEPVLLNASQSYSNSSSNKALQYRWKFGNKESFDTMWLNSFEASTSFTERGLYQISLLVKDVDGIVSGDTIVVSIQDCSLNSLNYCTTEPICQSVGGYWYDNTCNIEQKSITTLNIDVAYSCDGLTCSFDASESSGEISSTFWFVDLRELGQGLEFSNSFPSSGTYLVSFWALDESGSTLGSWEQNITVESIVVESDPVELDFSYTCDGLTCSFDGSSSKGLFHSHSYLWWFNGGSGEPEGLGVFTSYTFSQSGRYLINFVARDEFLNTLDWVQKIIDIEAEPIVDRINIVGTWNYTLSYDNCPNKTEQGTTTWGYHSDGYSMSSQSANGIDPRTCSYFGINNSDDGGDHYQAGNPISPTEFEGGLNNYDRDFSWHNTLFESENRVSITTTVINTYSAKVVFTR